MTDHVNMVRIAAWTRIRDAIDEQTEALRQRVELGDPDDIHLAADVWTWSKLAHALCDLWASGRRPT